MTLNPSDFYYWYKEYPMFTQWANKRDALFVPKEYAEEDEDKQYDLTSKLYILMKRLGQDYQTILTMSAEERDKIFEMELSVIKREQEEIKKK